MSEDSMLMCLICFVLGFMVSRMMGGRLVEGLKKPEPLKPGDPCLYNQQCYTNYCDWNNPVKYIPHGRCA